MSKRLHASRGRRHQARGIGHPRAKRLWPHRQIGIPSLSKHQWIGALVWRFCLQLESLFPNYRGSEYPCGTRRAFAFVPPFPSSAHLRTKRALRTRPSEAFSGSSSSFHTRFSKVDCSSAFFAVMKVRRSSMATGILSNQPHCPSSSKGELQPSKLQRVSCP